MSSNHTTTEIKLTPAIVRVAVKDDLEQVITLWDELIKYHHLLNPLFFDLDWAVDFRSMYFNGLESKCSAYGNDAVFVAEANGKIIGYVSVSISFKYLMYSNQTILTVEDIYVDEKFRHQGIGKSLIQIVKTHALQRKVDRIEAFVLQRNNTSSNFFENQGFSTMSKYMSISLKNEI